MKPRHDNVEFFARGLMASATIRSTTAKLRLLQKASRHSSTKIRPPRSCKVQYPNLLVGSTVDLLALESVEAQLGRWSLADAAYHALTGARLRVLPPHFDWIVNLMVRNVPDSVRACQCAFALPGILSAEISFGQRQLS